MTGIELMITSDVMQWRIQEVRGGGRPFYRHNNIFSDLACIFADGQEAGLRHGSCIAGGKRIAERAIKNCRQVRLKKKPGATDVTKLIDSLPTSIKSQNCE